MININKRFLSEKEQNVLQILNELILEDDLSSLVLAKRSKLSPATVSRVLGELLERNLIVISGVEHINKGRHPKLYSFNKRFGCLMHFTFSSGRIKAHLTDLGGEVLLSDVRAFDEHASLSDVFECMASLHARLGGSVEAKCCGEVLAAGISLPGVVSQVGRRVHEIVDIPVLNGVNVYDYTEKLLGIPVEVNNVSWNAAIGEKITNYAFTKNLAYLNMTGAKGVGVGLILGNELVRGAQNYAGEVGLSFYDYNGTLDGYANGGFRLEEAAGAYALYASLEREMDAGRATGLKAILEEKGGEMTIADIERAVNQGDEDVKRLFRESLRYMAMILININYLVNPDFIVIGGCYSSENKLALKYLNEFADKLGYFKPVLRLSTLGGHAEVLGGIHVLKTQVFNGAVLKEAIGKRAVRDVSDI